MAVGKDGSRVYVGIIQAPGGVDVIDTVSMQRVKTVPTEGRSTTPMSRPMDAMSWRDRFAGATINVIDAKTEEPAWTLKMDLGIRPMTFNTNPDGSTRGSSRSSPDSTASRSWISRRGKRSNASRTPIFRRER